MPEQYRHRCRHKAQSQSQHFDSPDISSAPHDHFNIKHEAQIPSNFLCSAYAPSRSPSYPRPAATKQTCDTRPCSRTRSPCRGPLRWRRLVHQHIKRARPWCQACSRALLVKFKSSSGQVQVKSGTVHNSCPRPWKSSSPRRKGHCQAGSYRAFKWLCSCNPEEIGENTQYS